MAKNNKKNQHRWAQDNNAGNKDVSEERTDKIAFEGEVVEALPGTLFKVLLANTTSTIICTLAGKLRQHRIRILPGDKVTIEVSPYDLTRGRITWRR